MIIKIVCLYEYACVCVSNPEEFIFFNFIFCYFKKFFLLIKIIVSTFAIFDQCKNIKTIRIIMIYTECERLLVGQNSGASNLQQFQQQQQHQQQQHHQASVITQHHHHHHLNLNHHHHPDYIAAAIALSPTKYNSSFTVTNLLEESFIKKQTNSEIILQSNLSSPSSMPLTNNTNNNNNSNSNLNNIDNNNNNSNSSNSNNLQTIIIKQQQQQQHQQQHQQQLSPTTNININSNNTLCNYQSTPSSSSSFQVSPSPTTSMLQTINSNNHATSYFSYPPSNHPQSFNNNQYCNTNDHLSLHYGGIPASQTAQYTNTNGWYSSGADPRFTSNFFKVHIIIFLKSSSSYYYYYYYYY